MSLIIDTLEQGSPEWHQARLGIPTASQFKRILTPTGKLAAAADTYKNELLADWIKGESQKTFKSEAMENGSITEHEARLVYKFITGSETEEVGLGYLDERRTIAASPDSLVDDDGGLELKCPILATHIGYCRAKACPAEYKTQVQGNLWVFERDWWDFMSYSVDHPPLIVRVPRDEAYIMKLSSAVLKFSDQLEEDKLKIKTGEF